MALAQREMGNGWEGIAVGVRGEGTFRSCQAHNVGISPQENRGGAAGTRSEVESGEEGGERHGPRIKSATSVAGFSL